MVSQLPKANKLKKPYGGIGVRTGGSISGDATLAKQEEILSKIEALEAKITTEHALLAAGIGALLGVQPPVAGIDTGPILGGIDGIAGDQAEDALGIRFDATTAANHNPMYAIIEYPNVAPGNARAGIWVILMDVRAVPHASGDFYSNIGYDLVVRNFGGISTPQTFAQWFAEMGEDAVLEDRKQAVVEFTHNERRVEFSSTTPTSSSPNPEWYGWYIQRLSTPNINFVNVARSDFIAAVATRGFNFQLTQTTALVPLKYGFNVETPFSGMVPVNVGTADNPVWEVNGELEVSTGWQISRSVQVGNLGPTFYFGRSMVLGKVPPTA